LPCAYLLVAVVASLILWSTISRRSKRFGPSIRNRTWPGGVSLDMKLHRLLPLLLLVLGLLMLVSACGGKGGGGY